MQKQKFNHNTSSQFQPLKWHDKTKLKTDRIPVYDATSKMVSRMPRTLLV